MCKFEGMKRRFRRFILLRTGVKYLRRTLLNLDQFIITCFCLLEELLPMVIKKRRLRTHGPAPKLTDSEVITMEIVGAFLGIEQDKALYTYFQRHYAHFFPTVGKVHRSTFF